MKYYCSQLLKFSSYFKEMSVLFVLFFIPLCLHAKETYEFWFAAPHFCEHSKATGGYHLVLFSYEDSAHIEVSMPANKTFSTKKYTLAPFDFVDIQMANDYDDAFAHFEVPFDTVSQRGICINSSAKIGGYYHHTGHNSEVFSLKGDNALGKEFYVPNQVTFAIQSSHPSYQEAFSSVQIVATEDHTIVQIIPIGNHPISPNCTDEGYTVILNKGETYAFRSCSKNPKYGVNGTRIVSNKLIAITSTDDSTQVGVGGKGLDAIGDQIVPIDYVGTEYVLVGGMQDWNCCYITSLEEDNEIELSNGYTFTLAKDSTATISLKDIPCLYIKSQKKIIVFCVTGYDDEAGGTMVPSIQCTGSRHVVYKRIEESYATFASIITRTNNIEHFYINNQSISKTLFSPVLNTNNEWSYSYLNISNIDTSIYTIKCTSGLFQLGITDVIGTHIDSLMSCSYGYFSDYGTSHEYDEYGYLSKGGTYTWLNHTTKAGQPMVFTSIGVYADTLQDLNGCDSICVLHLSEIPYPDNVDTVDCVVPPMASNFEMKELFRGENVNSMSTPLVADLDGDGVTEIIAAKWNNPASWTSMGYHIFNGQTGDLIRTINIPEFTCYGQSVTIADADKDGKSELYQLCMDSNVYCYNYDGTQKWKSINKVEKNYISQIADINNDGIAELIIGKYIYNAVTGALLHEISLVETGMGYGAPHSNPQVGGFYLSALADIDNDGSLELCAGNTIYKLNITNHNGISGNSSYILRQAEPLSTIDNYDGQTIIVDFDGDGDKDICVLGLPHNLVSSSCICDFYIWDGQTNLIISHKKIACDYYQTGTIRKYYGPSIPFVGDIDGDKLPEVIFNMIGMNEPGGMHICTYDTNQTGNVKIRVHTPFAETAGFTVYDFNMDGRSEIVYRGRLKLNIIDGITLQDLCIPITAYSGTVAEYPIVADVNNDGQAEIIVCRAYHPWTSELQQTEGWVSVYGPAQHGTWSSARSVWNQWAYNSVNINDDMTVPQYQYDIATQFPNGTKPFNSFLAQKPIIDKQGDIFVPAADAAVTTATSKTKNDSIEITLTYCNHGDANLVAPYEVAVYQNEYHGSVVQVDTIHEGLAINACSTITIMVPSASVCQCKRDTAFVVAINDDGHGIAQNGNQQAECDTSNNITKVLMPNGLKRDTTHVTQVICETELPYTYEPTGTVFPEGTTGQVDSIVYLINQQGCDSLVRIHLTILPNQYGDTSATFCKGKSFTWYEHTCTTAGDYKHTFKSKVTGCDSIVTLHLNVISCWPEVCNSMGASISVPNICADDDSLRIHVEYMDGKPWKYSVHFHPNERNRYPFADVQDEIVNIIKESNAQMGTKGLLSMSVPVPSDALDKTHYPRPDKYKVDVQIMDSCYQKVDFTDMTFMIQYPSWILQQRWNDVIALYNEHYNGGYRFSTIRWYHEGILISGRGDHNSYIYVEGDDSYTLDFGTAYWAGLVREGESGEICTCVLRPERTDNTSTSFAPMVQISSRNRGRNLTIETIYSGVYRVYDICGRCLQDGKFGDDYQTYEIMLQDQLAAGTYMIVFTADSGESETQKVSIW